MRAIGRLLRLSLTASCIADVLGGALVAGGSLTGAGHRVWLTLFASLGLYHGGMALNDWADRGEDARLRPDRPVPAGAVSAPFALGLGLSLLAVGVLCAWSAGPLQGRLASVVAILVLAYDLGARGQWIGPLSLGAARAGNLALGMSVGLVNGGATFFEGAPLRPAGPLPFSILIALIAIYASYVVFVSRLGRFEDAPEAPEHAFVRRLIRSAAGLLLAIPALGFGAAFWSSQPTTAYGSLGALAVVALAVRGLLPLAERAPREPHELLPVMGALLRRLLIATSAMALLPGTLAAWVGGLLLVGLGYPVSHALRRVFPPS